MPLAFLPLLVVLAHGGQPIVRRLEAPAQFPGSVWAVTDSQGIFAGDADGFLWLCEDAVAPAAELRWATPVGLGQRRWLVGARESVFVTEDRGCSFAPVDAVPTAVAASVHPERPDEVVLASDAFGIPNDVFRSLDAGRSWVAAGIETEGRITSLVRAAGAPEVVYVTHEFGAARSDDGGASFVRIKPGPDAVREFVALAAAGPDAVIGYGLRFPEAVVARSADAGRTWSEVTTFDDFPVELVLHGERAFAVTLFDGAARSEDGGRTWRHVETPVERLGCLRMVGERLWGCTNVWFGGPWAVGFSDDFGVHWRGRLATYGDAAGRWPCVREAPARACCQHLCPGEPAGASCADSVAAPGPTCADAIRPDAGPDGGSLVDAAGVDVGSAREAGPGDSDARRAAADAGHDGDPGVPRLPADATARDATLGADRGSDGCALGLGPLGLLAPVGRRIKRRRR